MCTLINSVTKKGRDQYPRARYGHCSCPPLWPSGYSCSLFFLHIENFTFFPRVKNLKLSSSFFSQFNCQSHPGDPTIVLFVYLFSAAMSKPNVWHSLFQEVYIFSGEIQAENHSKNIQYHQAIATIQVHQAGTMNSLTSDTGINYCISTSGNPDCIL